MIPEDLSAALAIDLDLAMQRLRGRLRSQCWSKPLPWTRSQLIALDRIVRCAPLTTNDLAAAEHMRPQSMAQIVAALERDRLIERHADTADKRRVLITPTDTGRDAARSAFELRGSWLAEAIDQELDEQERTLLPTLIGLLNRLAGAGTEPAGPVGQPVADR